MVISKKYKMLEDKDEMNDLHDLQGLNCVGELK
jgi:hypothetical protein